ncbi:MAG: SCO family protein [Planctomycetes bacterium]|nr:SCO family protein [Planctomycetota bacterium]
MKSGRFNLVRGIAAIAAALAMALPAAAQDRVVAPAPEKNDPAAPIPRQVRGIDIDEHLGAPLPMELEFRNSKGELVHLGDYFKNGKPAVMAMVYYKCPVVCDIVMQRMADSFDKLDFTIGKDFNALLFSFDATETPKDAAQVKASFISGYSKPITPQVEAGWEFHTGAPEASRQLANALGFKYRALENGQFSHPVAVYVITPQGRISQYLYGYSYPPQDMRLALMNASEGKLIKSLGDRLMSYCYMYDPNSGRYALVAIRVMQVAGVFTVIAIGGLIGALVVGERVRRRMNAKKVGAAGGSGMASATGVTA